MNDSERESYETPAAGHGALEQPDTPQEPNRKRTGIVREVIEFALIAFIIVVPIRMFIAQPFIVQGASMQPTFDSGQYIIVDQLSYRFEQPERGDVIIFRHPDNTSTFLIKRIVGLPGETLIFSGDTVTVKNGENPDGIVLDEPYVAGTVDVAPPSVITLGIGEYFVLGDNRAASSDSRVWGPLENRFILGRAFLRLLPITEFDVLPGNHSTKK